MTLDTQNNPKEVADDVVVSIDYTLTVEGQVVDSTEGEEPLQFLQGHQNIIPGLERELAGMKIGDKKTIVVSPAEAYGEVDPENVIDVPRSEFPAEIPLDPGTELEVKNADGEVLSATIAAVTNDGVKLDFNHPLAGKELTFQVKVVDLRAATDEELAHGHVHFEDDEDFEFEEDEEFDDDITYEELDEDEEDYYDDEEDLEDDDDTYRRQ
ncbi:MAG: peptidylprolyl isomerase [Chloroflexi bacterium]|nr:peptidylprolyl isomerase [Chloroflexota bacterium]